MESLRPHVDTPVTDHESALLALLQETEAFEFSHTHGFRVSRDRFVDKTLRLGAGGNFSSRRPANLQGDAYDMFPTFHKGRPVYPLPHADWGFTLKRHCGNAVERRLCTPKPCPRDCAVGEFTDWTVCSQTCGGGITTAKRGVLVKPSNGGKGCPALVASVACNVQPCPNDCEPTAWSAWSACETEFGCGEGIQYRTRKVRKHSKFGGKPCGALVETRSCDEGPCPSECLLSEWTDWSDCSQLCGGRGFHNRSRTVIRGTHTSKTPCGDLSQHALCEARACPQHCQVTQFGPWGECRVSGCGPGLQFRHRNITQTPKEGGAACPSLVESSPCEKPCAVDCKTSDWSQYSLCSAPCGDGIKKRYRTVFTPPKHDGQLCPELFQYKPCTGVRDCPKDCVLSPFGKFSDCSKQCAGGVMTRHRFVLAAEQLYDGRCGELEQSVACHEQPCGVDCVVSRWSDWSQCSQDCHNNNDGTRFRTRSILQHAAFGGEKCPSLLELEPCGLVPCPVPCEVSEFGDWSPCNAGCGSGREWREKKVLVSPSFGGAPCPRLHEDRACEAFPCPPQCAYSLWTSWRNCSQPCGGGVKVRSRAIVSSPDGNVDACGAVEETKYCNTQPCPLDCAVGPWSHLSPCSATCGRGTMFRTRAIVVSRPAAPF